MFTKTMKKVMTFGFIVAAVLIGVTFIMSSNASAAIVTPGATVVHPSIMPALPMIAPRLVVAPRPFFAPPFVRPFFNPFFFPRFFNPFFFDVDVNPFFFDVDVAPEFGVE